MNDAYLVPPEALDLFGASAVQTAVLVIDRMPQRSSGSRCEGLELQARAGGRPRRTVSSQVWIEERAHCAIRRSISILLAAAAVSGGALGPAGLGVLGASFAGGSIGASVLATATGIGGRLEVWG
jgi:hypothetical protein